MRSTTVRLVAAMCSFMSVMLVVYAPIGLGVVGATLKLQGPGHGIFKIVNFDSSNSFFSLIIGVIMSDADEAFVFDYDSPSLNPLY